MEYDNTLKAQFSNTRHDPGNVNVASNLIPIGDHSVC